MDEFVKTIIQYAPAVAVLCWITWRFEARQETLVNALVDLAKRCSELENLRPSQDDEKQ